MLSKRTTHAAVIITLAAFVPVHVTAASVFDTIVSYWALDEGAGTQAFDIADGNDGELQRACAYLECSAPSFAGAGPAPVPANGDALRFSGTLETDGGVVTVSNNALDLEPNEVTVTAWVKPGQTPDRFDYIVAKNLDEEKASYALYTGPDGGLFFYIATSGEQFVRSPGTGPGIWNDGTWRHVAGTYDGNVIRLYVDGDEISSGTVESAGIHYGSTTLTYLLEDVSVGNYGIVEPTEDVCRRSLNNFCDFDWKGDTDEVTIFSSALSPQEIATLAKGDAVYEGCSSVSGGEIRSLEAVSGATPDGSQITVTMALCGPIAPDTQYKLHFDYEMPLFSDPDRDGDGIPGTDDDFCFETMDDSMIFTRSTSLGDQILGASSAADAVLLSDGETVLTYVINYSDLNGAEDNIILNSGSKVAIWAVADKDRAPHANEGDGCEEPEVIGEVIDIQLN